jgi:sulfur carrier protein ThiS
MSKENNIDPIRVGIVGLGCSGWGIHADGLSKLTDQFSIVAVCDPDKEPQQEAKPRFGCSTYDDYTDLVADDMVELVVVANPSQLHCQPLIAAMQAGKYVILYKPMATNNYPLKLHLQQREGKMEIQVKLYGSLRDYLPPKAKGKLTLDLPSGTTIDDIVQQFKIKQYINAVVNGNEVETTHILQDGEQLHLFRFMAGG